MIARRLTVHGRVQGVWYRAWAAEEAAALGISGWVRNRAEGTVELLAIGASEAVAAFIARCHEGPPRARVSRVDVEEAPVEPILGFEKRATR